MKTIKPAACFFPDDRQTWRAAAAVAIPHLLHTCRAHERWCTSSEKKARTRWAQAVGEAVLGQSKERNGYTPEKPAVNILHFDGNFFWQCINHTTLSPQLRNPLLVLNTDVVTNISPPTNSHIKPEIFYTVKRCIWPLFVKPWNFFYHKQMAMGGLVRVHIREEAHKSLKRAYHQEEIWS